MADVTKIFVVLVAVLSIALVGMVVPFVQSTQNYRAAVDDAQSLAKAADARRALVQDSLADAQNRLSTLQDEQNAEIVALKQQLNTMAAEKASTQADLTMQRVLNAEQTAELKGLAAAERQHADIIKTMAGELGTLRERVVRLSGELVMETDAKGDLAGQLEAAQRQNRVVAERLALAEAEGKRLAGILEKVPADVMAVITNTAAATSDSLLNVPSVEVTGKVTKVQEMDNQTFIQVDIGSQDQVGVNTKLVVFRKGSYVASIAVIAADPKVSVGRVLMAKGPIQVGDSIVTGPGYN